MISGTVDTSTPATRQTFADAITSDIGGASLPAKVAAVANYTVRLPAEVGALLNLPDSATYAMAAAQLQARWAPGTAAF